MRICIITNTESCGGSELSVIHLAKMFSKIGEVCIHPIQDTVCVKMQEELAKVKYTLSEKLARKYDILILYSSSMAKFFHVRSFDVLSKIETKKRVMVLNYELGNVYQRDWSKGWDKYIFLSSDMEKEFNELSQCKEKTKVLAPPVDLTPFLKVKIDFTKNFRLVKLSSAHGGKYRQDCIQMMKRIMIFKPNLEFYLMPPPSVLTESIKGIHTFEANEIPIANFLSKGNLFYYPVESTMKAGQQGPRVVIEAMACGMPVIASNVSGLKDRITPETGWLCEDKEVFFNIIQKLTFNDLIEKGSNARKRAIEVFNPLKWIEEIC